MSSRACVVIDAQCGFSTICPNELPVNGADKLGPKISALLETCEHKIVSKEAHPTNALWITNEAEKIGHELQGCQHADKYWPAHCISGTRGAELLPGLPPLTNFNLIVYKGVERDLHPYGACYHDLDRKVSTGLIEYLKYHRCKEVLVCGLAFEFCVKETVMQLLEAMKNTECRIILCAFACEGLTSEGIESAKQEMIKAGCSILSEESDIMDACHRSNPAP